MNTLTNALLMSSIVVVGGFGQPLAFLEGVAPPAREVAQQPPLFRTGIDSVPVDVQVIDKSGNPVPDLTAADFRILVDGTPRPVTSAQFVRYAEPDRASASTAGAEPPVTAQPERGFGTNDTVETGRLVALVVDQGNLTRGGGRGAMEAATRFLDRLAPADLVGLLTIPVGPSVDFTRDKAAVKAALLKVVGGGALEYVGTGSYGLSLSEAFAFTTGQQRRLWNEAISWECRQARTDNDLAMCIAELEGLARNKVAAAKSAASISLDALKGLMRRLASVEGPKQLVVVGQGLVTGTEFGDLDLMTEVNDFGVLVQAARVTLSVLHIDRAFLEAFDVKERFMTRTLVQDSRLLADGLVQAAGAAGGAYYSLPVNYDAAFDRIAREIAAAYEIAFDTIASDRDGKTHKIEVKVNRPDVTVRARRFFGVAKPAAPATAPEATTAAAAGAADTAAPAPPTPEERLARVLESPVARTALPLRLRAHALGQPGGTLVRLLVAAEVGRGVDAAAPVTVGYLLRAPGGTAAGRNVETVELQPIRDGAARAWYYSTVLVVPPGDYGLRLAALDSRDRVGMVEVPVTAQWVEVGPYRASDLLLTEPGVRASGKMAMNIDGRVSGRDLGVYVELRAPAPAPATAGGAGTAVPSSAPFQPAVRFDVINPAEGSVLVGRAVRSTAEQDAGRAFAEATLDLSRLAPGQYVLRVAPLDLDTGEPTGGVTRTLRVGR
jgi:VWFA-related protein